ncbi:MAG: hypothetical protein AAFW74_01160 [Pseudomonadota bacterium]
MRMVRSVSLTTFAAVAFVCQAVLASSSHAAGGVFDRRLFCDLPNLSDGRPVEGHEVSDKAYGVDFEKRHILFFPRVALRQPKALTNLQFAEACLKLAKGEDTGIPICEAFNFLKRKNWISSFDIEELQDFYFSSPSRSNEGRGIVKQLYSCF